MSKYFQIFNNLSQSLPILVNDESGKVTTSIVSGRGTCKSYGETPHMKSLLNNRSISYKEVVEEISSDSSDDQPVRRRRRSTESTEQPTEQSIEQSTEEDKN